jgi:large conductance mechanosensitive channel
MLKDFKAFVMRGNVMDLAVGVIIGGAFGKIVSSLVNDVIMPLIGLILGKVQFSNLFIDLSGKGYATLEAAKAENAAVLTYGNFIQNIVDFLIIAFVIFLMVRAISRLTAPKPAPVAAPAEPTTKECPHCISTIPIKATRCPNCTSQL